MPWVEFSKPVMSFILDAYRFGFVIDFSWPDWQETAVALQGSPEAMRRASLVDLAKLLSPLAMLHGHEVGVSQPRRQRGIIPPFWETCHFAPVLGNGAT